MSAGPQPAYATVNPATEEIIAVYPTTTGTEVDRILSTAQRASEEWAALSVDERTEAMRPLGNLLQREREGLAELASAEMGKPRIQAEEEIDKSASAVAYYVAEAPTALAPQAPDRDDPAVLVRFDPLGTVLAIMPWNYPFWQVLRVVIPTLLAGNTCLLKPSPVTIGCALAIRDLLMALPMPSGAFDVLVVDEDTTGNVIEDPRVRGITLTGSVRAGRHVAARAGNALKPCVLELGGSDPFIVLDGADVEEAARVAVLARMQNSGQSCIAAKRFIVAAQLADAFIDALRAGMAALVVGEPGDPATDIGPLATQATCMELDRQVKATVQEGARLVEGGFPLSRRGWYYAPTLFTGTDTRHTAFREETFGPVAAVTTARDAEHAFALANATAFGLGASVWSPDRSTIDRATTVLDVGTVTINGMTRSDPRFPFGGVKDSGHGRELGREGLVAFTNVKTVRL